MGSSQSTLSRANEEDRLRMTVMKPPSGWVHTNSPKPGLALLPGQTMTDEKAQEVVDYLARSGFKGKYSIHVAESERGHICKALGMPSPPTKSARIEKAIKSYFESKDFGSVDAKIEGDQMSIRFHDLEYNDDEHLTDTPQKRLMDSKITKGFQGLLETMINRVEELEKVLDTETAVDGRELTNLQKYWQRENAVDKWRNACTPRRRESSAQCWSKCDAGSRYSARARFPADILDTCSCHGHCPCHRDFVKNEEIEIHNGRYVGTWASGDLPNVDLGPCSRPRDGIPIDCKKISETAASVAAYLEQGQGLQVEYSKGSLIATIGGVLSAVASSAALNAASGAVAVAGGASTGVIAVGGGIATAGSGIASAATGFAGFLACIPVAGWIVLGTIAAVVTLVVTLAVVALAVFGIIELVKYCNRDVHVVTHDGGVSVDFQAVK